MDELRQRARRLTEEEFENPSFGDRGYVEWTREKAQTLVPIETTYLLEVLASDTSLLFIDPDTAGHADVFHTAQWVIWDELVGEMQDTWHELDAQREADRQWEEENDDAED